MLYVLYFLAGLMIGSFLNVVIYRMPRMLEQQWRQEIPDLNLCLPASHCAVCKKPLSWLENIPLISFMCLKGRCQSCKNAISWQYPLVELTTGLLFLLWAWYFGGQYGVWMLAGFIFLSFLMALSVIDWQTQLLPDQLTLPFLWSGLLFNAYGGFVFLEDAVWGAAAGYISLWLVYWIFRLVRGKEGLGYGDFKLLAGLGAWLGWQMLPLIILLGSILGVIAGIVQMIRLKHGKDVPFAFGPYLAMAGVIALLFGHQIMDLYMGF